MWYRSFLCAGEDEEEMEQEMEHLEEGREQLSEPEGGWEDEPGGDQGEMAQRKSTGRPRPKRLFTFSLVNSYGTADINALATDGKLLKLSCKRVCLRRAPGPSGEGLALGASCFGPMASVCLRDTHLCPLLLTLPKGCLRDMGAW